MMEDQAASSFDGGLYQNITERTLRTREAAKKMASAKGVACTKNSKDKLDILKDQLRLLERSQSLNDSTTLPSCDRVDERCPSTLRLLPQSVPHVDIKWESELMQRARDSPCGLVLKSSPHCKKPGWVNMWCGGCGIREHFELYDYPEEVQRKLQAGEAQLALGGCTRCGLEASAQLDDDKWLVTSSVEQVEKWTKMRTRLRKHGQWLGIKHLISSHPQDHHPVSQHSHHGKDHTKDPHYNLVKPSKLLEVLVGYH